MKALVGDRIAIMSRHLDEAVRTGEIIEVHGAGGEPPFVVRWLDTGHTGVLYPGPDALVQHHDGGEETGEEGAGGQSPPIRSGTWQTTVGIIEYRGGRTRVHVLVDTGLRSVAAHGEAQRLAGDMDVPQVGAEVAAGRAFIALGEELLGQATRDIEDVEDARRAGVLHTSR